MMGLLLGGCAGAKPVLYPNSYLKTVGGDQAQKDIDACRAMAEEAGAMPGGDKAGNVATSAVVGGAVGAASGAVGGAIVGAAGSGSAIGAVSGLMMGLFHALLSPTPTSDAYKHVVDRCLKERGYEPVGWQ
jgi:hypothetical protein